MSAYDDYSEDPTALRQQDADNDNYEAQLNNNDDPWADPKPNEQPQEDLRTSAPSFATDQLDQREAALIVLEKRLMEKNQQLEDRSELVGDEMEEDNWPCHLYPITYHSIKKEIPANYQSFVRAHYRIVKLTMFGLFWNFCVIAIMYLESSSSETSVTSSSLLWATVYMVCGVPGAWKLWYKAIYRAAGAEKTFKFMQYFVFATAHFLFFVVACIGISSTSLVGFLLMLDAMKYGTGIGVCAMICFADFVFVTIWSFFMLKKTWSIYKSRGGDLKADMAAARGDAVVNIAGQAIAGGKQ